MKLINQLYIVAGFLAATIFFSACGAKQSEGNQAGEPPAGDGKIQSVEVVKPQQRDFTAEVLISGTAEPNQKVMVYAMESGYVQKILKDIGDNVRKGEVIAVLQNPQNDQLISDAQAALKIGQAELLTAKAELEAAQADWKAKNALFTRLNGIYKSTPQLTPVSTVEKAEGDAAVAKAAVETMKSKITAQEWRLEAHQKSVEIAKARKAMLSIKAPFDGKITKRLVDRGTLVQSGLTQSNPQGIVEIQDISPISLRIALPESDVAAIHKGMEVNVSFPELPGKAFNAKVSRTAGALDPASKTMQVEIDIANPKGVIKPGMYAKAVLQISSRKGLVSLPVTAQWMFQNKFFVLIVKDDKVERIPLRKGLSNKDYFEVLNSEITENSLVIVQGKGLVQAGQIVNPVIKSK